MSSEGQRQALSIPEVVAELRRRIKSSVRAASDEPFREEEYLQLYPDVAEAVRAKRFRSAREHWEKHGRAEGRRGTIETAESARMMSEKLQEVAKEVAAAVKVRAVRNQSEPPGSSFDRPTGLSTDNSPAEQLREQLALIREMDASPPSPGQSLGKPTPKVGTIRGRAGHILMRLLSRLLWWYTRRIQEALEDVLVHLGTRLRAEYRLLEMMAGQAERSEARLREIDGGLASLEHRLGEFIQAAEQREADRDQRIREIRGELADIQQRYQRRLEELANATAELQHRQAAVLARTMDEARVLANRVAALASENQATSRLASELQGAVETPRKELEQLLRRPGASSLPPELEDLYMRFENEFRGSLEEISDRQSIYIPVMRECHAGEAGRPVLDLGCGRGEWLRLLKENSLAGRGVDISSSVVQACQEAGLVAVNAEAISYLRGLAADSLGAVTAYHLVEHLTVEDQLALVAESFRVLKSGGVLILETPNPDNLLVGSSSFYLDPTHRKPVPWPLLRFLMSAAGFSECRVLFLHPAEAERRLPEDGSLVVARLNEHLYGPRDYAVIGKKV